MDKAEQCAQASRQELADGMRRHYEHIWRVASEWNSGIQQAIDAWEREPQLTGQIDKLAKWILANVPGEPSRSEGAVDTAIRLLAHHQQLIHALDADGVALCEHECVECGAEWGHLTALQGGCINPYRSGRCAGCIAIGDGDEQP